MRKNRIELETKTEIENGEDLMIEWTVINQIFFESKTTSWKREKNLSHLSQVIADIVAVKSASTFLIRVCYLKQIVKYSRRISIL